MSTGGAAAATPSRIHLDRGATWRVSEQLFLAAKQDPIGEEVADVNLYRLFGRRQPDWYEDQFKAINGVFGGELDTPGVARRSVLDPAYGAVADGVTDCTAAFQAALDQVASEGGGEVYVPPVTNLSTQSYLLNGEITIPAGVYLVGAGGRSLIRARSSTHQFGFAVGFNRSGIRDLVILGNSSAPAGIGVRLTESQFITLERLELWDFECGIECSDGTSFSAYLRIEQCEVNRCATGIRVHQSCNGVTITGGRVFWCFDGLGGGIALDLQDARGVSVEGLALEAYDYGLRLAGATSGSMTGCWLEKGDNLRADFLIEGFEESPYFEGNFDFRGNHTTDRWPLQPSTINVREYGAAGDGTTDDTAALQHALDDAADRPGTEVYFPAGTYIITAALEYPGNVALRGSGVETSVISKPSGSGFMLQSASPGSRRYNLTIRDLDFVFAAGSGLRLDDMSEALVERVEVQGPGIGSSSGTCITIAGAVNGNAVYNSFHKVRCISAAVGFAIYGDGSNETHLNDCRATACVWGVQIEDANHTVIDGCAIEACVNAGNGAGVMVESTSANLCDGTTIVHNRFENNDRNIVVAGTPGNVRYLQIAGNHHVTGTAYTAVDQTTFRCVRGDTGTASSIFAVVSPVASGPAFHVETTVAGVSTATFRSSNIGSGTPTVLTASAGRAAAHALSIATWSGSADTETAYITAAGALSAVSGTFSGAVQAASGQISGDLTFTGAASTIYLGDGTTAGNTQTVVRKADANNVTYRILRIGTATTGNRLGWQWDSSEVDQVLSFDGSGNLHAIRPFRFRYSATSGRTETGIDRLSCDLSTTLVNGNFALSASFGSTATAVVAANSKEHRGQVTITPQGSGIGANPTITLTYPDGTRFAAGWTIAVRNGGTDSTFTIPGTHWTIADSATGWVITLVGTPISGATLIFRWWMAG